MKTDSTNISNKKLSMYQNEDTQDKNTSDISSHAFKETEDNNSKYASDNNIDVLVTEQIEKNEENIVKNVSESATDISQNSDKKLNIDKDSEIARLKEELLRLHADMENTKKRLNRLFDDRVRGKTVALLLDIIEHIDNFERAFESHQQLSTSNDGGKNIDAIFDGFIMIKNQLLNTLINNWGLQIIESLNLAFDPEKHEALMQEKSDEVEQATVVQELMKGYTYLGKVIRPSKVKVALPN